MAYAQVQLKEVIALLESKERPTLEYKHWKCAAEFIISQLSTRRLTSDQLATILQEIDSHPTEATALGRKVNMPNASLHRLLKVTLVPYDLFTQDHFSLFRLKRKQLALALQTVAVKHYHPDLRDPHLQQTVMQQALIIEELRRQLENKVDPLPIRMPLWDNAHNTLWDTETYDYVPATNVVVSALTWLSRDPVLRETLKIDSFIEDKFNQWTLKEKAQALSHFFQVLAHFKRWDLIQAFTANLHAVDTEDEGVGNWQDYVMKVNLKGNME